MKIGDLAREAPFVTRVTERPGIVVDRVHDVHGSIRVYLYASKVGDFRFLEEERTIHQGVQVDSMEGRF